jgi:uncharacterized protein YfiM (DUF2279 family)
LLLEKATSYLQLLHGGNVNWRAMEKQRHLCHRLCLPLVVISFLFPNSAVSAFSFKEDLTKEQKLWAVNTSIAAFIATYGFIHWDYGKNAPSCVTEHWFSEKSKDGGSDKLGHFYNSYMLSFYIPKFCESWGYTEDDAAFRGFISSMGLMTLMEIGDSFSNYGFSHEDMVMNILGATTGYFFYRYPNIDRKIDFRVEYQPTFDTADFFTDFKRMKFLFTVKLEGFDSIIWEPLKYLELHLGYYVRGFSEEESTRSRHIFFGAGINVSRIFRKVSYKKTAVVLEHLQVPYTYVPLENEIE